MKKLFITLLTATFFASTFGISSAAITPTPKTSPTPASQSITQIEQQINNLKDRIASRVAQLKLVEKRGIIGTVTDVSETQITVKDIQGNLHFIDVDELTKFSSPSVKSNFGISDIAKNNILGILGLYNKESRRILARFVDVTVVPQNINGAIAAMDKVNYTVTIVQNDGTQIVVEIEDVTKITSFDKTAGLLRSGFSKMIVGQRVHVIGYPDKQNTKQLIASRLIILPTTPVNPAIADILPKATPTTTPTNAVTPTSAKKITPAR